MPAKTFARVVEVVLVEPVVLEAGAGEPGAFRRFAEQAAARGYDLEASAWEVVAAVEVVVCGPGPEVLDVCARRICEMYRDKRSPAVGHILISYCVRFLEVSRSTHSDDRVPDADVSW